MKHIDAAAHTRGESIYVDDSIAPAGMLYAAVFASPIAHGKLQAVYIDQALAIEGVVTILTAKDIPGCNQIGSVIQDEDLLATDKVQFVGHPIAIVIATSSEIAQCGVHSINVDIEQLPAITDPRDAFAQGKLIAPPRTFVLGDVDSTWEQCDHIVEGVCDIGGQEHVYLETQRARAVPLEGNTMRVYSSTQSPYIGQKIIAQILGLPYHCIEVDVRRLGGAFGGKEDQATRWACIVALATWHTKQAVELVLSRMDDMKMTGKRHPYSVDFKMGVRNDGKILAYDVRFYQNAGAVADLSTAILERTLFHATNSYFIPNVRIFAASCRTNLPPNTAFRGFGGPQAMFVIESAITKVAQKLKIAREEIQCQNLVDDNDQMPYGQRLENARARATWQQVVTTYQLEDIRQRIDAFNDEHYSVKKGYALMPICFGISFTTTFLNQASSLVHVYTDGSVGITTGGVEMGQGLNTKIAAIAAKTFGISSKRIRVESTNTTRIANMSPTAASAGTDLNGGATIIAARQIVARLKKVVAKELQTEVADAIDIVDEKILVNGKATEWTWKQVVQKAYFSRVNLSAHAFYATPDIWFDKQKEKGRAFAYHVFGTAIVEVTVDCLRGTYDIDSVKIVHDLGRPINELVDRGQIIGGLAQGLGWMTLEELRYDDQGRLLSNSLATYKAPDVYFMPDDIEVKLLENADNPIGPYGSKAVGEPPLMYGIGVFFAIYNAMRAYNPKQEPVFAAPFTPERVLMQLHGHRLGKEPLSQGFAKEAVSTPG